MLPNGRVPWNSNTVQTDHSWDPSGPQHVVAVVTRLMPLGLYIYIYIQSVVVMVMIFRCIAIGRYGLSTFLSHPHPPTHTQVSLVHSGDGRDGVPRSVPVLLSH